MNDLIGPNEAGRRLGVSPRTVQRWLRSGRLPAVRVGSRIKVDVSSLSLLAHADTLTGPAGPARPAAPIRPIRRLLVANRGELVVRIARTCRGLGITTLALATGDQRDAWWTRAADEVVPLATGYLDGPTIVETALAVGADAMHPGYGFLAEQADFAEAVIAAGLTWVGPPPGAMRALGDKAAARRLAVAHQVPVLPGYDGRGQSDAVLQREASRIGYPVLAKPSAGGGGKGMHVVRGPGDLRAVLALARREATAAFGDDRLILERYLDRPRHVEVQLLLDAHGGGIHLGERDCSLQRRHQKVVEEAPAPGVTPEVRESLGAAALRLARAAGYVGAGTAEFLLADDGTIAFLEMNARLQVEHPVTEAVTGIDLVAAQLRIAAGEPLWLQQSDVTFEGHAIEARLYAEDPWNGFLPAAGRVAAVEWPSGHGIRVDTGIGDGDEVGTRYDPLLAKLIATGPDRGTALARLSKALAETRTLGVTTNRGFLAALLAVPEVADGAARTDTIDVRWHPEPELPESAWAVAAEALMAETLVAGASGRPGTGRLSGELSGELSGKRSGTVSAAGFRLNGPRRLAVEIEGERRMVAAGHDLPRLMAVDASPGPTGAVTPVETKATGGVTPVETKATGGVVPMGAVTQAPSVAWAPDPGGGVVLDIDGRAIRARLATPPTVEAAVRAAHHGSGAGAAITAPMPGVVSSVNVVAGESVEAHQVLVVLEAMKMENAVSAPVDGVVERVLVGPGQAVQRGDLLVELTD